MKKQPFSIMSGKRRGSVLNLVLIGLLGVILLGAGTWVYLGSSGDSALDEPLTSVAFRGLFVKEVLDQGEIQSSDNVEIRSNVKSRYGSRGVTVKRVVEEGTKVKPGDFLLELRSDEIQENFDNQTIEVNNARDAVTAAQNNYDSAVAAQKEYEEGLYNESKITITNEISEAQETLNEAENYYKFSLKLQAKNFITETELRSDESRLARAKRSLDLARKKLFVLEEYTKPKMMTELESAKIIADSKLKAAKNNLEIEEATLAEIEEQLDACSITCPEGVSGQVVYANIFSRRGNSEFVLEEGATVREGQVLIKIPNPDRMQVRATVNESRVTSIRPGMDVEISVDALNGAKLDGVVTKVNAYAEPEGWGGGGVRKYAVYVDILNPGDAIRPGMNAAVMIETDRVEDALMTPIQTVYGYRGKTFCLVRKNDVWKTVEVEVGSNNDTNVVILKGLEAGDEVAMNPAGYKELMDLPDLPELEENSDRDGRQEEGRSPEDNGRGMKNRDRESDREDNRAGGPEARQTEGDAGQDPKSGNRPEGKLRGKQKKSEDSSTSATDSDTVTAAEQTPEAKAKP